MNIINKYAMLRVAVILAVIPVFTGNAAEPDVETKTGDKVPLYVTALSYAKYAAVSEIQMIRRVLATVSRSLALQRPDLNSSEQIQIAGTEVNILTCYTCHETVPNIDKLLFPCMCNFHIDCADQVLQESKDEHFSCPACQKDLFKQFISDDPEGKTESHPIVYTRAMMLKEVLEARKEKAERLAMESALQKKELPTRKSDDSCVIL